MNVISQSAQFVASTPNLDKVIEFAGRTCYKSHDGTREGSAEKLIKHTFLAHQHESVLEHGSITMHLVTDRATMAQITRHRLFSFSIESQRYCSYNKDKFENQITVIEPYGIQDNYYAYKKWNQAMVSSEQYYFEMLELGCNPELARSVLPNSTKTETTITGNIRQWRAFFKLRTTNHAQKDIKHLCDLIHKEMISNNIPSYLFDDIFEEGME